MVRAGLLIVTLAGLDACSDHECTLIGCQNQATVTLVTADGTWPEGDYALTLAFDDATFECSFTLPDDGPGSEGSWQPVDCTPALDAYLAPVVRCSSRNTTESSGQTCSPVEDQFYLQAWTPGTPKGVHVTLARDDEMLVDEVQVLAYRSTQPNGPDCDPVCQQASTQVVVP